jgi:hypothetical protein
MNFISSRVAGILLLPLIVLPVFAAASVDEKVADHQAGFIANSIEMLRDYAPDSTCIRYVISQGGMAPNIIPDLDGPRRKIFLNKVRSSSIY